MNIFKLNETIIVNEVISDVTITPINNEKEIFRLLIKTNINNSLFIINLDNLKYLFKNNLDCDNFLRNFANELNLHISSLTDNKFVNYCHLYGYVMSRLLISIRQKFSINFSNMFNENIYTKNCIIGDIDILK